MTLLLPTLAGSVASTPPTTVDKPGALDPSKGAVIITTAGNVERDFAIKRACSGAVTVMGNFDGVSGASRRMDSPNGGERLALRWNTALATYLVTNYYDPGLKPSDLSTMTLDGTHVLTMTDPTTGVTFRTAAALIAALAGGGSNGTGSGGSATNSGGSTIASDGTLTGLPSTIVAGQPLSATTYTQSTTPAFFVLFKVADTVEEGARWASGAMPGALTLLIPQTARAYVVRGFDAATGGNKVYESAQFTVTAAQGALPAIPTQTADTGATSSGVTMNWTATGTSYRVLARAGVGSAYGSLADATVSSNSYMFTGLAANSSARAVIIPQNANGYGTPTGQFLATVGAAAQAGPYTFSAGKFEADSNNLSVKIANASDGSPVSSGVFLGVTTSTSTPPDVHANSSTSLAYTSALFYQADAGNWVSYRGGATLLSAGTYYIWAKMPDGVDRLASGPLNKA